jgi:hypothetical protein
MLIITLLKNFGSIYNNHVLVDNVIGYQRKENSWDIIFIISSFIN